MTAGRSTAIEKVKRSAARLVLFSTLKYRKRWLRVAATYLRREAGQGGVVRFPGDQTWSVIPSDLVGACCHALHARGLNANSTLLDSRTKTEHCSSLVLDRGDRHVPCRCR